MRKPGVKYFIACDDSKEAWDLYQELLEYMRVIGYSFAYHNVSNCIYTLSPAVAAWTGLRSAYCPHKHHEYIYVEAARVKEFLEKFKKTRDPNESI